MSFLSDLNEPQREAVFHEDGPLLVLAGAGSGKTRVITYRIAYLINERGIDPANILAVTFTNKAAQEMRTRVSELVDGKMGIPLISTFHSFCLRVLRSHIHAIGYPNSFSIYDVDDQVALLRRVINELGIEGETPKGLQARISAAKNSKYGPDKTLEMQIDSSVHEVYKAYQKRLKAAGALDFDDLLLLANQLLESEKSILLRYQKRFQYVLVDEYQDTNFPQYQLIRKLSPPHNNVCAVGDDDQSIYRWRGADVENILRFSKDFPGTRIIKLEQNYRSYQNILDAAHGVVERLLGRHPKKLWTSKGKGERVTYFNGDDEGSEASFVVRQIDDMLKKSEPSDFAILFRTNAQSRPFEEALGRHRIPFQLVGGTRFYDRAEIKDILAYMQLAANPADIVCLRRIINTPTRGIGDVSISKLEILARNEGISFWQALSDRLAFLDVQTRAKRSLKLFKQLIDTIAEHIEHGDPPAQIIDFVLKESGYLNSLIKEGTDEAMGRIDNLKELLASARSFEEANPDLGTADFLDQVALVADTDEFEPDSPKVTLMTLHCAKGLEFPVVFLVGMEDGLLPHSRNINEPDLLEEERRLCYVGMTRARDKLFLTSARSRHTYSGYSASRPSRFLDDIPSAVLDGRGAERLERKRRLTTVGANIENIGNFFKDRKISVDLDKLEKHATGSEGEFRKGDEVFLSKYGKGTIVGTEGEGEELRYLVYFPSVGRRKKLLARAAKLTKV